MANFKFECPKCSYKGENTELLCTNCNGIIERIETSKDYEEMQCVKCGINQCGSCPNCDALITFKTTRKEDVIPTWVFIVGVIVLIIIFA